MSLYMDFLRDKCLRDGHCSIMDQYSGDSFFLYIRDDISNRRRIGEFVHMDGECMIGRMGL